MNNKLNLLIDSKEKREIIRKNMINIRNDIKNGCQNVFDLIFKE